MSFLRDLKTQLEEDGVATFGTDLFFSTMAAIPVLASGAATLQVIETGGTSPEHTQNSAIVPAYIKPSAQLTARANSYEVAFEKMAEAIFSLCKVRNQFINSGWYRSIKQLQQPFDGAGPDDKKQAVCKCNIMADIGRRPAGY